MKVKTCLIRARARRFRKFCSRVSYFVMARWKPWDAENALEKLGDAGKIRFARVRRGRQNFLGPLRRDVSISCATKIIRYLVYDRTVNRKSFEMVEMDNV